MRRVGPPIRQQETGAVRRPVHAAGSTTRKLIGRPYELLSMGAIAPSIEQYAGTLPVAATHRGAESVTPATGSPMADVGIVDPRRASEQSSAVIVFTIASEAATWDDCAVTVPLRIRSTGSAEIKTRESPKTNRRLIVASLSLAAMWFAASSESPLPLMDSF